MMRCKDLFYFMMSKRSYVVAIEDDKPRYGVWNPSAPVDVQSTLTPIECCGCGI